LIIATIAQRFRLQLEPGQEIALNPLITLSPKYGLKMRLVEREQEVKVSKSGGQEREQIFVPQGEPLAV
jgi:hypothetical protein